MKWNMVFSALVVSVGLCGQSFGFELLNRTFGWNGGTCCDAAAPSCGCAAAAPSCGCAAPAAAPSCGCAAPAAEPSCGAAPSCGVAEPSCGAAPSCGCGSTCCRKHCNLFGNIENWLACHKHCHRSCCGAAPSCGCAAAAPSCGCAAPAEPSCGAAPSCGCAAVEPSCGAAPSCGCGNTCGKRRHCLVGLFHRHHGCCDAPSCCTEATCSAEPSCAAPSCGCGGSSAPAAAPPVMESAPPLPPAPTPDGKSTSIFEKRSVASNGWSF